MARRSTRRVLGLAASLVIATTATLAAGPAFAQKAADRPDVLIGLEAPGSTLTIRGSDHNDFFIVRVENDYLFVTTHAEPEPVRINDRCRKVTPTIPNSIRVNCGKAGPVVNLNIDLGDGKDQVIFYDFAPRGTVNGGAGDDQLIMGEAENSLGERVHNAVSYQGGDGQDRISYHLFDDGVRITPGTGSRNDGRKGFDQDDIAADVEELYGSRGADHLYGTAADNVILGDRGNDVIRGHGGKDEIWAGPGDDTVYVDDLANPDSAGVGSPDRVLCGTGNDRVTHYGADDISGCEVIVRKD